MQHSQAVKLLSGLHWINSEKQVWADFGCGRGTFTLALAQWLSPESQIIAVDKDIHSLKELPDYYKQVGIEKKVGDFLKIDFPPGSLDGILMANSLHFVRDQAAFIQDTKRLLKPEGSFLIVEYDLTTSNPWVPYPVHFEHLKRLFTKAGFPSITKLNETPSLYNRSNMYSALIHKRQL